jgi:transcription elongation factor GreA
MNNNWENGIIICADPAAETAASSKLDPQVRALLEADKADAVEELLLSRISESPCDLRFFVPVIRHYVKNEKSEIAQMFLDLLLDSCRTRAAESDELSLLRALLLAWPEALPVRTILVEKLRKLYGGTPNIKRLIEHCKIFETAEPLRALRTLEYWLRYEAGRGVYMVKKGGGRISEINLALGTVRAVFPDSPAPLSFKLDEAARLLVPLSPGSFLLDTIDQPEALKKAAINDGGGLLGRLFLEVNRPLPLNELRDMLTGIVPADKWSSWWLNVRKDRRLTVTAGNLCTWNDSSENADTVIQTLFMAAPVNDRMEIIRRYSDRSPALVAAMTAQLAQDACNEREKNPGLALELLLTIEKSSSAAENRTVLAGIINRPDAAELIRAVQNRSSRKRALALVREYRQDWPALYAGCIRSESDMQLLTMLYDLLREKAGDVLDGIITETMSSPAKADNFFIWLCREMPVRAELQHLANWQFIQLIMQLLTNNSIKKQLSSLKKLFDDDGVFHITARNLDPDQAKQLTNLLEHDTVLEDYRRDRLLKDLRSWYPNTQEIEEKIFYVSAAALKARQEEFVKLTSVDIPHNTEEIIKARAHGDLRENFEYHAARARQEMLSSRAKTLHDELQSARPVERAKIDPSAVCIGTAVRLSPVETDAESVTITILGPWDSDPARNIFSYLTPAAKELLARHKGDQVQFNGKPFLIADIIVAQFI